MIRRRKADNRRYLAIEKFVAAESVVSNADDCQIRFHPSSIVEARIIYYRLVTNTHG